MPAIPHGVRGAVITGWGTALPPKVVTNDDLEQMSTPATSGSSSAPASSERHVGGTTAGLSIEAGPQGARDVGRRPGRDRRARPGHHHARPHRARRRRPPCSTSSACAAAPSTSTPPARASSTASSWPTASSPWAPSKVLLHRHRHARPHHRLERPQHRHPLRRRLAAPSCSRPSTGPGQLLGWDLDADGAAERFLYAEIGGYIQMDGKEVFRRAVRIMVDSAREVDGARRRHRRRHRPRRAPPGQHPHHRGRLPAPRHPDGARPRPSSTTPATRRRPRSRSRSSTPSTTGRVDDGDLVLLVGFGAGMTAASAVLRWGGDDRPQ